MKEARHTIRGLEDLDEIKHRVTTPISSVAKHSAAPQSVRSGKTAMRLTQTNLMALQSNIGSLHETDICKICVKTMQPS